jgi:hypothetical protein
MVPAAKARREKVDSQRVGRSTRDFRRKSKKCDDHEYHAKTLLQYNNTTRGRQHGRLAGRCFQALAPLSVGATTLYYVEAGETDEMVYANGSQVLRASGDMRSKDFHLTASRVPEFDPLCIT